MAQLTAPLPRHRANATNNDFIYMTLPLYAMAMYFYGARPLVMGVIAALTANLCDRLVAVMRRLPYNKTENSSMAYALILALLMPASIRYHILITTVVITVMVGKAAFGGYGVYPFSPPALGFAVAAVSWPTEMFLYPEPFAQLSLWPGDASPPLVDSAAHTLAAGGLPNISIFNLILGNYAGGMGITPALVLLACAAYLWLRKRITLAAPCGFLVTCALFAYFFPRLGGIGLAAPWHFVLLRLQIVAYELLSGALLYAAVFLVNDDVTLPRGNFARLAYGIILGIVTMLYRYYGSYDMSVCFVLLAVNVLAHPLDRLTVWCGEKAQSRKKGVRRA